ncbi:(d)CMP kinase [Reichenbachiella agariperforans]|uniref:(d)CMP kinase n=1 Tax=Reichenbachiella agariperforans TaxID=156994 RepID=UPI001C08E812|nr:(d)CMP kinase [Reichenbachiella agariperforans]MBU2916096.1 (d)CMP kinase [Reichenbachiella agariperforans]
MKKIIIAIDGYSACGKSSTAKQVASKLNYRYVDTGAMYRAVTLYFMENYIDKTNPKSVEKALDKIEITFHYNEHTGQSETYLNGLNVEKRIREMEISQNVSEVSAIKAVRIDLVKQQQKMGRSKGLVMDGRDIGSVVFPEAELKIFMTADFDVRAERRQKELFDKDQLVDLDDVKANLKQRDTIDTTRAESPLTRPEDSVEIDTTHMFFEEQVDRIVQLADSRAIKKL